jgi:hypothetical protein
MFDSGSTFYPQVCWQNICPGLTTTSEAEASLRINKIVSNVHDANGPLCWNVMSNPSWEGCLFWYGYRSDPNDFVDGLVINVSDYSLKLGDALLLFGEPIGGYACYEQGIPEGGVSFGRGLSVQVAPMTNDGEPPQMFGQSTLRLSPESMVFRVYFSRVSSEIGEDGWKGFATGYCPNRYK